MTDLPKIPGQELERASANVAEHVGKGLFNQLDTFLGDVWAKSSAHRRAAAAEIRKNIAHRGELDRQTQEVEFRRQLELSEIGHQTEVQERNWELLEASKRRLGRDLIQQQKTIEEIASRAIEYKELEQIQGDEREIEDDWLLKFFRYAGEIDESKIVDVLSKALAEAATHGKPRISNRALDTLRFFDINMKRDFEFLARNISIFGFVHREHDFGETAYMRRPDDYANLFECGLVKSNRKRYLNFDFCDLDFLFSYELNSKHEFEIVELTQLGSEIFGLFDNQYRALSESRKSSNVEGCRNGQLHFGLTEEFATVTADRTIATTSDTDRLGVTIFGIMDGKKYLIFDEMKEDAGGPFGLPKDMLRNHKSGLENPAIQSFSLRFEDYDKRASSIVQSRTSK